MIIEDRGRGIGRLSANRPADTDAVEAGQHDVEDNQVEGGASRAIERLAPVGDLVDGEPGEIEVEAQQLANRRFVLDDERAAARRACGHGTIVGGRSSGPRDASAACQRAVRRGPRALHTL